MIVVLKATLQASETKRLAAYASDHGKAVRERRSAALEGVVDPIRTIEATARRTHGNAKPIWHVVFSWSESDAPLTPEHALAAVQDGLTAWGASDLQYVAWPHADSGHRHVHVLLNMADIARDNGKRLKVRSLRLLPSDREVIIRAAGYDVAERGIGSLSPAVKNAETHNGTMTLARWIAEGAADVNSWESLDAYLGERGLRREARNSGHVIVDESLGRTIAVRASLVGLGPKRTKTWGEPPEFTPCRATVPTYGDLLNNGALLDRSLSLEQRQRWAGWTERDEAAGEGRFGRWLRHGSEEPTSGNGSNEATVSNDNSAGQSQFLTHLSRIEALKRDLKDPRLSAEAREMASVLVPLLEARLARYGEGHQWATAIPPDAPRMGPALDANSMSAALMVVAQQSRMYEPPSPEKAREPILRKSVKALGQDVEIPSVARKMEIFTTMGARGRSFIEVLDSRELSQIEADLSQYRTLLPPDEFHAACDRLSARDIDEILRTDDLAEGQRPTGAALTRDAAVELLLDASAAALAVNGPQRTKFESIAKEMIVQARAHGWELSLPDNVVDRLDHVLPPTFENYDALLSHLGQNVAAFGHSEPAHNLDAPDAPMIGGPANQSPATLSASLPPAPAAGTVRLWRAESSAPRDLSQWIEDSPEFQVQSRAFGRWYTDSLEDLEFYRTDASLPGYPARIKYVDLPIDVAAEWRVSNIGELDEGLNPRAYSRRPESEYFLPPEALQNAREMPALEARTIEPDVKELLNAWSARCANKRLLVEPVDQVLRIYEAQQVTFGDSVATLRGLAQTSRDGAPFELAKAQLQCASTLAYQQEVAAVSIGLHVDDVEELMALSFDDFLAQRVPADDATDLAGRARQAVAEQAPNLRAFAYDASVAKLATLDVDQNLAYNDRWDGHTAFIEKDGNFVLARKPVTDDIDRALRLSAMRYGKVTISGDKLFVKRAVERAAALGIDCADDELQKQIAVERERLAISSTNDAVQLPDRYIAPLDTIPAHADLEGGEALDAQHISRAALILDRSLFRDLAHCAVPPQDREAPDAQDLGTPIFAASEILGERVSTVLVNGRAQVHAETKTLGTISANDKTFVLSHDSGTLYVTALPLNEQHRGLLRPDQSVHLRTDARGEPSLDIEINAGTPEVIEPPAPKREREKQPRRGPKKRAPFDRPGYSAVCTRCGKQWGTDEKGQRYSCGCNQQDRNAKPERDRDIKRDIERSL